MTIYSKVWITKDGRQISYNEMTDNHLWNTLLMLEARLTSFINRNMSRNEELDPPEWVVEALNSLYNEHNNRLKKLEKKL